MMERHDRHRHPPRGGDEVRRRRGSRCRRSTTCPARPAWPSRSSSTSTPSTSTRPTCGCSAPGSPCAAARAATTPAGTSRCRRRSASASRSAGRSVATAPACRSRCATSSPPTSAIVRSRRWPACARKRHRAPSAGAHRRAGRRDRRRPRPRRDGATRDDTLARAGGRARRSRRPRPARRLEQRLLDAGARPADAASKLGRALASQVPEDETDRPIDGSSTAGEAVTAYLQEQVAALVGLDASVRVDVEDAVHKMRVAARRLRSALATYRRLLDREVTEPLRDELKWLGGVLGPVRDAEVIRDHLRTTVDEQPHGLVVGPVRRRIDRTMSAEHRDAHRRALVELSSPRYLALLDALERRRRRRRRRAAPGSRPPRCWRRRSVAPTGGCAGSSTRPSPSRGPDDHLLHEVRKAAKRVRYAGESAAAVLGAKATALAERMEEGQEVLGAHQDSVVVRDLLRRLADRGGRGGRAIVHVRAPARPRGAPRRRGRRRVPGDGRRRLGRAAVMAALRRSRRHGCAEARPIAWLR